MAGNQNACVLPIGWEMGPPFCTDAALLHAMNHLQTEHEGKNLCFIKETYTITFIHHKMHTAKWSTWERKNGFEQSEDLIVRQVWESHF